MNKAPTFEPVNLKTLHVVLLSNTLELGGLRQAINVYIARGGWVSNLT